MTEGQPSSYEVLPYQSHPFVESHPDTLAVIGRLFGLRPPGVGGCRVLELGCASGGNLIPMALALPGARFLGIDASSRQVEAGRETIAALGLGNVELQDRDIAGLPDDLGTFDYIICHGVYSWVPEAVQAKILGRIAASLAEQGVAYLSYNTYPGWHLRGMVRGMLGFHARKFDGPAEQVKQARAFLDVLTRSAWSPESTYARFLEEQAARLRPEGDDYLYHEFLEPENRPVYYRDLVDRAGEAGLACLADARLGSMLPFVPPALKETLGRLSSDPVDQEQYLDFLRNRAFRRTLLCRAGSERTIEPQPEALGTLWVTALVPSMGASVDLESAAPEEFQTPAGSVLTIADPLLKAALVVLAEHWPRPIPFDDLWAEAHARIESGPSVASLVEDPAILAAPLIQGYAGGWVGLHAHPVDFATEPGDRPVASPLARRQVEAGDRATNLRHQVVDLGRFDRQVLRLLDGTRDREAIVGALITLIAEGALTIRSDDPSEPTPDRARQIVRDSLEQSLQRLAVSALLMS